MNTTKLYLLDHHVGASSGIIYAHKGDEVEVITYCINMVLVKHNSSNSLKFWVNINKLSDVPILKEKYERTENTKSIKSSKKKRI